MTDIQDKRVVISLYMNHWYDKNGFIELIDMFFSISNRFDLPFTKCSYGYFEKGKDKLKGKELNISKFNKDEVVNLFDQYIPGGVEFYSTSKGAHLTKESRLACIYSSKDIITNYSQITLVIDSDSLQDFNINTSDFLLETLIRISKIIPQAYGLVDSMSLNEHPILFFGDYPPRDIPDKWSSRLRIWKRNRSQFNERIWDIFWGNVVKEDLLGKDICSRIKKIIGDENWHSLGGGSVFFTLTDNIDSPQDEQEKRSDAIKALFPSGLLMVE